MKREKTVSMTITEDEDRVLIEMIQAKERELGKRLTLSSFLREHVLKPFLNGNCLPPQETVIETPDNEPPKKDNPWDGINF